MNPKGLRLLNYEWECEPSTRIVLTARVAVSGCLLAMPRPRANRRGFVYLPTNYKQFAETLRTMLKQVFRNARWAEQYRLTLRVYKPFHPTSLRYGDGDNLLKTVMDALPFDDRHITVATVEKRSSERYWFVLELHLDT
jgi:Holliday junction resolvase RusA-like endonuclease